MESAGARLKKLRLEKGISLEELHKKTKISLDILKALEEDSLININPVYIKGFLKIYCQYLGIDFKDYIPDYKEPRGVVVKYTPATQKQPLTFLKAVLVKLVSLKAVSRGAKRVSIGILIFAFLLIGFFYGGRFISRRTTETQKVAPSLTMSGAVGTESKARVDTAFGIKLAIRAKENCWIRLKTDGKVVFQNILRKGRTENWQAKDKIKFSLGNAGGVDLEVNGKLISNLGRRGQALKNIAITKEGLKIPQ